MHSRALGSLSAILHAAAARAWSRSASTSTNPPSLILRRRVPISSTSAVYFEPDAVRDSDFPPSFAPSTSDAPYLELAHSQTPSYWDDTSILGTTIGPDDLHPPTSHRFPLAKSSTSLYRNLLSLVRRRVHLQTLLDYHDLHPSFRSTRSYNLLISIAMRRALYGTVKWLLHSMHVEYVPNNLETWKWRVRWLLQSGKWDRAWKESNKMLHSLNEKSKSAKKDNLDPTQAFPLPIWLEFFRAAKDGMTPTRRHSSQRAPSLLNSSSSNSVDLYSKRYHTLMKNPPTLIHHGLSRTPPKTIYRAVWAMLYIGQVETALSLTKSYFTCLTPTISRPYYQICLNILHLLIAKGSTHKGLRRLYETRRMMVSLLSIYPSLRPTATTLFLLLAPLRAARRCGTVATKTVAAFKKRYGPHTEDRRVRRRVVVLALKEGRSDVVEKMLRREQHARWNYAMHRLKQHMVGSTAKPWSRKLKRPPARSIFGGNGQEERRWCRLIRRLPGRYDRRK